MRKKINYIILGVVAISVLSACKKEPDSPPISILSDSSVITIDSLRNWQESVGGSILIEDSISVYGTVSMDEVNGNIYKNIYLQGDSAAMNVRFTSSTDLIQGDYIRISLFGTTINEYSGVVQLDGVDEEKNVVVQSNSNELTPITLTISEIDLSIHESKLIKLENVQFKNSELVNTYSDAINQTSENRIFEDFDGNSLYIRTSGFANFAGDSLPKGSGSMICIVSEYNGELQLILRSPEEALMTGARGSGELLVKDFTDENMSSGGWTIQQVIGTHEWEIGTLGSWDDLPYAVITNYDGGNSACESWYISPALDFGSSTSASLSFDNAYNYDGDDLDLLISTDYSGTGDPNLSTWTSLSAIWSGGGFDFVNSGIIDLSLFLESNVHVAFKYTGSDSSGKTWEIDNIIING
mgnify:CR=1 FL=1